MEKPRNLVAGIYDISNNVSTLIEKFDTVNTLEKEVTVLVGRANALEQRVSALEKKPAQVIQEIQVIFIFLFLLILILVRIFLSRISGSDLAQTSEEIATLQQTPMYNECCQVLAENPELQERFEEIFQPSLELTTQEACNDYSLKIHQLYADIVRYLTDTSKSF